MAGTRWRIPGTAWSRTQQYNVSIVMIHRFSVSVGPCMYSRYEFIAEELSLIDTYMYTCNKWSQLNQAHILIHICSIFSVLRNILKFKLLLSFFLIIQHSLNYDTLYTVIDWIWGQPITCWPRGHKYYPRSKAEGDVFVYPTNHILPQSYSWKLI